MKESLHFGQPNLCFDLILCTLGYTCELLSAPEMRICNQTLALTPTNIASICLWSTNPIFDQPVFVNAHLRLWLC
jgi:hypothetical protein